MGGVSGWGGEGGRAEEERAAGGAVQLPASMLLRCCAWMMTWLSATLLMLLRPLLRHPAPALPRLMHALPRPALPHARLQSEVSMLPGSLTAAEFEARKAELQGKMVVCYCTVSVARADRSR